MHLYRKKIYLFHQGSYVIHHCGFGTASASLIYGIPSIPVPHVLDQFGLASTLKEIGVAGEPLNVNSLTEDSIIHAIKDMQVHYSDRLRYVNELSQKIRTENGLGKACDLIINVIEEFDKSKL